MVGAYLLLFYILILWARAACRALIGAQCGRGADPLGRDQFTLR